MIVCSDPVVNSNTNERSNVKRLLEKLILEDDQFDVHEILPNTVPDPSSLFLESDYACPLGQVVISPDCGKIHKQTIQLAILIFFEFYSSLCCWHLL